MPGPSPDSRPDSGTPTSRTLVARLRGDLWTIAAAITAFFVGAVTTWIALRVVAWSALKRSLHAVSDVVLITVTPFDVIVVQAQVALLVGAVLAVEAVGVRARGAVLPDGWWAGAPLSTGARAFLVAIGVALFPVGAMLGYESVFPVVADLLVGEGATVSVVHLTRLAATVSIAVGVALQAVFVGAVLAAVRLR